MRRFPATLLALLLAAFALGAFSTAHAQFGGLGDKVKNKAKDRVDKKVDKATDSALDTAEGKNKKSDDPKKADDAKSGDSGKGESGPDAKAASAPAEMKLFTKYDFIPGDKVIFYDDLAREEVGEFPSRWKLERGVFEVAKHGDRGWILCTNKGGIAPKIPAAPLPPKYTIEVDTWDAGGRTHGRCYNIYWLDAKGDDIGRFEFAYSEYTYLTLLGKRIADKTLTRASGPGAHTMRIMATKTTLKCYLDNVRVANVPLVEGFNPTSWVLRLEPYFEVDEASPTMVTAIRYAEGGKTLREQLDENGRIVTHGILFATGSAEIKGESYKTMADIGQLLTDDASLRLSIEGHTDSDGGDAPNKTLSEKRAQSVKSYLCDTYKIDASRLESKGWGKTKPIDSNATAEGKANNRRVELVKL